MDINLNRLLNPNNLSSDDEVFLKDLQGNVINSHRKNFAQHLFLRFTGDTASTRKFLREQSELLRDSSTYSQLKKDVGEIFRSVLLSASGYKALGINNNLMPSDQAFRDGLKARGPILLKDPEPTTWAEPKFNQDLHALVILAHDDNDKLGDFVKVFLASLPASVEIAHKEKGQVKFRDNKRIEHFGFVDGISTPAFVQRDGHAKDTVEGPRAWPAPFGLAVALTPCPGGNDEGYGSYLVFRKLEQNVKEFFKMQKELSIELSNQNPDEEYAAALVVGRFRDGTPLAAQAAPSYKGADLNNFNYVEDPEGSRCPVAAHIRKMNPRGAPGFGDRKEALKTEATRSIIRRSITYDDRKPAANVEGQLQEHPETGVGVLFMCYQSSIVNQFEVLQGSWANDSWHPPGAKEVGSDPISAQGKRTPPKWPTSWGSSHKRAFDFKSCINMLGGEYFFAPSISFFQKLPEL